MINYNIMICKYNIILNYRYNDIRIYNDVCSRTPATAADGRSNNSIHKDQNLSSSHVTFIIITILPYTATMIGFSIRNMHRSGARAHGGDAPDPAQSPGNCCLRLFTSVYSGSHLFVYICLQVLKIGLHISTSHTPHLSTM